MASVKFQIEAEVRQDVGKGASRRLRRTEKTPAVVYGADKETTALTLDHNKILRTLEHEAVYSQILTLKIGQGSERVILKDVQRHAFKPRIMHVDFQRIKADEKIHMHVPLHFLGGETAPGVKAGGLVSHLMSDVEVSCLPDYLPEYIEVDISQLELNQILHLSDVKLPKEVEIVALAHGRDQPIVSVHIPRIVEEETPAAEEAAPAPSEVPTSIQKGGDKEEGEEQKEK
ncbi:MAG: 50S ribosomal protein L25/general stress protein Ctc [Gammaproteobacteria bacterium RIFCSPHIGHO2_12_FULL_41_20]|nr:MAG: 50S ribosomal protein L25/general stress protein Ctc [Gammaproteobacteria bacterium RIFCSPHIGHO2_12_FULL_41_20]